MWYIIYNGQQVGPLERQQLNSYNLKPASMVWHEGMPEWQPAGNVPELQDILYHDANGRNANGYPNFGASDGKYPNYGQPQYGSSPYGNPYNPGYDPYYQPSGKKVAAGVLAILLGWLGVQYFYLGKIGGGLLTILLTLVTCGFWEIITFIQGIVMLTMSDQEFDRKFVNSKSTFPLF